MMLPLERTGPRPMTSRGWASPLLMKLTLHAPGVSNLPEEIQELARAIADALKGAARPLVVSGPSCRSLSVIESAANVAKALCEIGRPAALSLIAPECNSFGLALMGARPLNEALALTGKVDALIVLENDLYRRLPARQADGLLSLAAHRIVLDHLANQTTAKADLLLPAGTFAESDGTLVNNEGRAQRFFQVFAPQHEVRESWRWLRDPTWSSLDDVLTAITKENPELAAVIKAAPLSDFRLAGARIPREPHRYSGLTSITANISVVEPKPPQDPDSALSYSMEGAPLQPPSALQPFFWSPGWNSIQAVNKFQSEIGGATARGRSREFACSNHRRRRRVLHHRSSRILPARDGMDGHSYRTHLRL